MVITSVALGLTWRIGMETSARSFSVIHGGLMSISVEYSADVIHEGVGRFMLCVLHHRTETDHVAASEKRRVASDDIAAVRPDER